MSVTHGYQESNTVSFRDVFIIMCIYTSGLI